MFEEKRDHLHTFTQIGKRHHSLPKLIPGLCIRFVKVL